MTTMISVTAVSSSPRNVLAQLLFLLCLLPSLKPTCAVTVAAIPSTHGSQHQNQHQHRPGHQHRDQCIQEQTRRRRRRIQVEVRGGGSASASSVSGKSTKNTTTSACGAKQVVHKTTNTTITSIAKTTSKNRNALVVGMKNFLASGCAAGCSKLILAPFDTIKTLQQHQQSSVTMSALSIVEATRSIMSRPRGIWELYVSCLFCIRPKEEIQFWAWKKITGVGGLQWLELGLLAAGYAFPERRSFKHCLPPLFLSPLVLRLWRGHFNFF
jgi:Mitochondrial carrier protein